MNPNETGPVLIRESRGISPGMLSRRTRKNRIFPLAENSSHSSGGESREMEIFSVLKTDTRLRMESDSWIGKGALETEFFFDIRLAFVKQKEMGRSAEISDLTENLSTGICVGSQQVTEIFPARDFESPPKPEGVGGGNIPFAVSRPSFPGGGGGRCEHSAGSKAIPN
ncbi:hypothetical protein CDAR_183811 [Caerostris darwini]|uniref:Uncharacterized protein n=1 Tax=Caerostris darwini TaxID=1538125 RepID=A0AAV4TTJ6_9ARAC|nr:hypothetical protein CDAR_183811 [Caerostris darwini]